MSSEVVSTEYLVLFLRSVPLPRARAECRPQDGNRTAPVRAAAGCGVLARALDRHSSKFVQNLVLNAEKEQVCIIGVYLFTTEDTVDKLLKRMDHCGGKKRG